MVQSGVIGALFLLGVAALLLLLEGSGAKPNVGTISAARPKVGAAGQSARPATEAEFGAKEGIYANQDDSKAARLHASKASANQRKQTASPGASERASKNFERVVNPSVVVIVNTVQDRRALRTHIYRNFERSSYPGPMTLLVFDQSEHESAWWLRKRAEEAAPNRDIHYVWYDLKEHPMLPIVRTL